jgi:L-fuculose-phosphate aldolase
LSSETQLRADICEVGRRMYARGYTASNDGNISVRLGPDRLLMTPASVCKGFMSPDMMVITDLDGNKIAGERTPSSEMQMHLEVYRRRPDVQAVVHAHPPIATGFAVAGIPLDRAVLAEVVCTLGSVPIAEYATPSTKELPEAVSKYVQAHDGMLLANHGALTMGKDLFSAYYKMETAWWPGCSAANGSCRGRKSSVFRTCAGPTALRPRRRSARTRFRERRPTARWCRRRRLPGSAWCRITPRFRMSLPTGKFG